MKKILFVAFPILAVILLAGVFFQPLEFKDFGVTIQFGAESKALLERFGLPDGAHDITAIKVTPADGTLPEIAIRSFSIDAPQQKTLAYYQRICQEHKLGQASAEQQKIEPDMICKGKIKHYQVSIHLDTDCHAGLCICHLQAQLLRS